MRSSLLVVLVVATGSTLPLTGAGASPDSGDPAGRASYTTMSAAQFESRLFARTNLRRARHGCRALRLSSALVLDARRHSSRMVEAGTLSHRLGGEPGLGTRADQAGYLNWRILAENLAWGQSTPSEVFRDWVNSPGHRANLDNCRLREIGLGVLISDGRPWVTQDFGRR